MTELALPFFLMPSTGTMHSVMLKMELSLASTFPLTMIIELPGEKVSNPIIASLRSLLVLRSKGPFPEYSGRAAGSSIRSRYPTADMAGCVYNGMLLIELSSRATPMLRMPCGRPDGRRT